MGQILTAAYQSLERREVGEGFPDEGRQAGPPRLSRRVPGGRGLAEVGGQGRDGVSALPGGSGPVMALDTRQEQGEMR